MKVITAPERFPFGLERPSIFLAGSIEMGTAIDWQQQFIADMSDIAKGTILNPRRVAWDASWKQDEDNPEFRDQVYWELDAIDMSDIIVFRFLPDTKSPISLLELGLVARSGKRVFVHCPTGFWRKGNVDIVCSRHGIKPFSDFSSLTNHARNVILNT